MKDCLTYIREVFLLFIVSLRQEALIVSTRGKKLSNTTRDCRHLYQDKIQVTPALRNSDYSPYDEKKLKSVTMSVMNKCFIGSKTKKKKGITDS